MLYHKSSNSVLLRVRDPLQIRELIPHSKLIDYRGHNVAFEHTLEATKVLRNIGINAPAPIRFQYRWPGKFDAMEHQKVMAEFLTLHRKCFNLSEMGTMKTAAALWAADWLMETGRVRKAVILSPLSTLERVWLTEIFDVLMHRVAVVVHGTREKRERAMNAPADFYIINHDGLGIGWLRKLLKRRNDIDLIILDEASEFRNAGTNKYEYLEYLLRPEQRLWLMTGTPCPNEPTDAWALARLVNPNRVPKFFGQFRRMTMEKNGPFKWLPKKDAYKLAYEAMQPAVRFKKRDCIELPPVTTEERQVQLSSEQIAAFKQMRKEMQIEAQSRTITAVNAADKVNKLRQILCGAIKDPASGEYQILDHRPRTQELLNIIGQASAKVIVVAPFKGIVRSLSDEIGGKYSVGILNGDVSARQRNIIIENFKHTAKPHVLLCHPRVMSHGLNLTEADTLVLYAPIYSNDQYEQVLERFNRAGQKNKMTVIKMGGHALEWAIYGMLDQRRINQNSILSLYKSVVE